MHTRLSTEEPEHTYAVLEQTQTPIILPTGLEESEQHDIMILEPNGEKKQPTSPRVSDKHSSRDVELELPVYDKVSLYSGGLRTQDTHLWAWFWLRLHDIDKKVPPEDGSTYL